MSASKKYGYIVPETGKIETLPLATMNYDPVKEAEKLYGEGKKVVFYQYSIKRGNWGEAIEWSPTMEKANKVLKKETQPKPPKPSPPEPTNNRTIRDLTPDEKLELQRGIEQGAPNSVIVRGMGLKRSAIDQYRHYLKKKGTVKQSTKSAPSAKSIKSIPSIKSIEEPNPWHTAEQIMNNIIDLNDQICALVKERKEWAEKLQKTLQEVS